jgi:hypothetical protein
VAEPSAKGNELRACLKEHGVEVPGDDDIALKRWLLEHGDDDAYRDAFDACNFRLVKRDGHPAACGEEGALVQPVPRGGANEVVIFKSRDTEARAAGDDH